MNHDPGQLNRAVLQAPVVKPPGRRHVLLDRRTETFRPVLTYHLGGVAARVYPQRMDFPRSVPLRRPDQDLDRGFQRLGDDSGLGEAVK